MLKIDNESGIIENAAELVIKESDCSDPVNGGASNPTVLPAIAPITELGRVSVFKLITCMALSEQYTSLFTAEKIDIRKNIFLNIFHLFFFRNMIFIDNSIFLKIVKLL